MVRELAESRQDLEGKRDIRPYKHHSVPDRLTRGHVESKLSRLYLGEVAY